MIEPYPKEARLLRYQVNSKEDGNWSVVDSQKGIEITDPMIGSTMSRLSAQALADLRNSSEKPEVRVQSRLKKIAAVFRHMRRTRKSEA